MNDTAVIRGTIISFICDVGYSLHGAEYLTCGIDADWNNVVPVCLKGFFTLSYAFFTLGYVLQDLLYIWIVEWTS